MGKEASFKNRDRLIQLGIVISSMRKMKGMTQEELAEKANMSRAMVALIESPHNAKNFSLETFYNLADALEVAPSDLIGGTIFTEEVVEKKESGK